VNVKILAAPEDVLAKKTLGVSVGNCLAHDVDQVAVFAANVDIADLRSDRQTGNDHSLDHRMWIVLQNKPVLAGAALGFVAVHQNVRGLVRLLGHKPPLHAGGKSRPTASAQVGSLDLINNVVGLHGQRFLHSLVAVKLQVGREVSGTFAEALGDNAY